MSREERERVEEERMLRDLERDEDEALEVVEFLGKGRGVKAKTSFEKGQYVVEYVGDFMTAETGKSMELEYSRDPSIGSFLLFFHYKSEEWCVDATSETEYYGRLINHSKAERNVTPRVVAVRDEPRVIFVARRRIQSGEEILYDYNDRRKDVRKENQWLRV